LSVIAGDNDYRYFLLKNNLGLLAIAKTGVELAVKTNEVTATDWINQHLKALGVIRI
jgi:hypothetical protein